MFNRELQTVLTNLGAVVGRNNPQYKRKLKEGGMELHKGKEKENI